MGQDDAQRYADAFRRRSGLSYITAQAILFGTTGGKSVGSDSPSYVPSMDSLSKKRLPLPPQNAVMGQSVALDHRVPAYGQAMGGTDGEFVLNGNEITQVPAPASLRGVPEAYAVFVSGESMENRYFAGEVVFVNPRLPVRRGDFVVVQIASKEGDPPLGYVKRFVSMDELVLRLEQFKPEKRLEFPRAKVVSVHRIVMAGEG